MERQVSIKWFYGAGIAFILLYIIAFYFNFPYFGLLPLALPVLYMAVFSFDKLLILISFLVPFSVPVFDLAFGMGLSLPTEPLIIMIFCGIILKLATGEIPEKKIWKHPVSVAILFNLSWVLLTSLTSSLPVISLKYFISRFWFVLPFYFIGVQLFKRFRNIKLFLWSMIVSLSILVFYTLMKHSAQGFSRKTSYYIMMPFYPDHGIYAAAVAFIVPMLFVFVYYHRSLRINKWVALISCGLIYILLLGILYSFTRAAWLSLAAALGVFVILWLKIKPRNLILSAAFFLVLGSVFKTDILMFLARNKQGSADKLEAHLQSVSNISSDPSNLERINRWKSALRMFAERPFLGWGPGTYGFNYAPFQAVEDITVISTHAGTLGNTHSEYMAPLSESGFIGLLSFLAILFLTVKTGLNLYYNGRSIKTRAIALGTLLGLVTYLFHGILNNYSDYDKIAVPLWAFIAIITALDLYHNKEEDSIKE